MVGCFVLRRDFDGCVFGAGRRAADQERQLDFLPLHFAGDVNHFVEAGRNQAAQADHVDTFGARGIENPFAGNHHAQVDHLVVVATEHDADDVFADVVDVAFDGGQEHLAARFVSLAAGGLLRFHEREQIGHGFFHDAGTFHHLRQEHFAGAEQIADDLHAGHQRTFDDFQRSTDISAGFFDVGFDEIDDAFDQRMGEPLFDRFVSPGNVGDHFFAGFLLDGFGELDQPFGGVGPAIEQHVFDALQQILGNFFVDRQLAGVDDAHIHAGANGVVQERRVHGFADDIVAAERERDVAHAAGNFAAGQFLFDSPRGFDEIQRVAVVLLDAGADGEDVRIENNVAGREADFLGQQFVRPVADGQFVIDFGGLAGFVEGHHDDGRRRSAAPSGHDAETLLRLPSG